MNWLSWAKFTCGRKPNAGELVGRQAVWQNPGQAQPLAIQTIEKQYRWPSLVRHRKRTRRPANEKVDKIDQRLHLASLNSISSGNLT